MKSPTQSYADVARIGRTVFSYYLPDNADLIVQTK